MIKNKYYNEFGTVTEPRKKDNEEENSKVY